MLLQGREEKRTETRNGAGNGLQRLGMKGREVVREKRRDGRDIATKSESRDEATTRWHVEKRGERVVSFSFTFLSEPRFKGREFNLCKFIMREHFAVYPWKPAAGIHRRAYSNSVTASCDRGQTGTGVFRSENEWRQESGDDESVDTCRGMAPGLKCPLHYREDAADRFRHAWPRKRDAGNVGFAAHSSHFSVHFH